MTEKSKQFLEYLNEQFPATVGHIPLKNMINDIYREGFENAAELVRIQPLFSDFSLSHENGEKYMAEKIIKFCSFELNNDK